MIVIFFGRRRLEGGSWLLCRRAGLRERRAGRRAALQLRVREVALLPEAGQAGPARRAPAGALCTPKPQNPLQKKRFL